MFDELKAIIKSDPASQEKFEQFKRNFWKKREKKRKDEKRRALTMSIVLAASAVVSIAFGFYAFKAQTRADTYQSEVERLQIELQDCSDSAN